MSLTTTFFTYILKCSDGTLYTGKTTDLQRRIKQHNGIIKGGAKYTRGRRPVKLLYSQSFSSLSDALKNENYIKSLSKKDKQTLIEME